jgi:hypothetical protein
VAGCDGHGSVQLGSREHTSRLAKVACSVWGRRCGGRQRTRRRRPASTPRVVERRARRQARGRWPAAFAVLLFGEDDAVGCLQKKSPPPQGHMRKGLNVKVIVTVGSSLKHQDFTRAYMHRAAHVIRIRYSLIFDS